MTIARFGKFKFDLAQKILKKGRSEITLSDLELNILSTLAESSGKLVKYEKLVKLYKKNYIETEDEEDLRVLIYRLFTKKLDAKTYLKNVRSEGYQLKAKFEETTKNDEHVKNDSDEIIRFFGKSILESRIKMIFAYRWLEGELNQMKCNLTDKRKTELTNKNGEMPTPEGVLYWIPQEDIRSAVYVTNLITQNCSIKGFNFLNDDHTDPHSIKLAITFGLFNCYTIDLTKYCEGNLFKIGFRHSPKKKTHYTDNIEVNGKIVIPENGKDVAVIARIVSHPTPKSCRIRFIVAGRTATGTAVAGYFLAEKWNQILQLFDDPTKDIEKDSVAVIITHTAVEKDSESIDESGVINTFENGEPMIVWARHGSK